ncbi:hypothetical protein EWM64_g347 [Hericium alpestre]|uniref:Uncharacterized protein n=1 Tax=Hericium alpestre TaxID=135208 RepID=A0A4Z0ACX7_9AGAM|nr:hypothetical protein EWM64_g347 [Hericium alpestre]
MWADEKQADLLRGFVPAYHEAQANKTLKEFWPTVYAAWFMQYPETDIVQTGPKVKGNPPIHTRIQQ